MLVIKQFDCGDEILSGMVENLVNMDVGGMSGMSLSMMKSTERWHLLGFDHIRLLIHSLSDVSARFVH